LVKTNPEASAEGRLALFTWCESKLSDRDLELKDIQKLEKIIEDNSLEENRNLNVFFQN
jgi:hypothetical protein